MQAQYASLEATIQDRNVSDEQLLKILCAQVFRGGDLDALHSPPQPSLAFILMKVTCPDNRTYTERSVVRFSV